MKIISDPVSIPVSPVNEDGGDGAGVAVQGVHAAPVVRPHHLQGVVSEIIIIIIIITFRVWSVLPVISRRSCRVRQLKCRQGEQ